MERVIKPLATMSTTNLKMACFHRSGLKFHDDLLRSAEIQYADVEPETDDTDCMLSLGNRGLSCVNDWEWDD